MGMEDISGSEIVKIVKIVKSFKIVKIVNHSEQQATIFDVISELSIRRKYKS